MAATLRAVATAGNAASGTASSLNITIPSTAVVGDVAVMSISTNNNTSAPTNPTGWTQLNRTTVTGIYTLLYKVLVAGDPGSTITISFAASNKPVASLRVWAGVDASKITFNTTSTGTTGVTTYPSTALTGVPAGAVVEYDILTRPATTTTGTATLPSGYTDSGASSATSATTSPNNLVKTGYKITSAAGSYGGESSTGSSATGVVYIVSLPAAALAFSGSIALDGSGVLSPVPTRVTTSGSLSLSGSGVLSTVPSSVATSGSLSLSGSGAQSLPAGKLAVNGALTLNGSGTATWAGKPGWVSSMLLGADGQVVFSGGRFGFRGPDTALSGSGTVAFSAARVAIGPVAVPLGGSSALGITPTRIVVPSTGSIAVPLAGGGTVVLPPGKPGFTDSLALSSGAVQLARTTLKVASEGSLDFSGVGSLVLHTATSFPIYVFTDQGVWRPVKYLRVWNGRAWLPIPAEHFRTY